MGARLWHHIGPWHDDPAASLREVQVQHLRAEFDYPARLAEHLASAREAVRLSESEIDDPYEQLDFSRAEVIRLEQLAALPPPTTPEDEIDRLRILSATSGEGIGCVLDVTGVSDSGGWQVVRRLADAEVARWCGSERPTEIAAEQAVGRISEELDRGQSVCFPVHDEEGRPRGWCFVGVTID